LRSFAAATIFIADVICLVDLTEFILSLIVLRLAILSLVYFDSIV